MGVRRRLLKAGTLFALLAGALIAGLALLSVESRAQQASQDDLHSSAEADRSQASGPHDARTAPG
jgi:hypothetical protein